MRGTKNRRIQPAFVWAAGSAILAMTFLAADGCASDQDADPTPVQTFKITPAATTPTAVAVESAIAATPTESIPTPATGQPIVIAGVSSEFDVEEITAPAGPITIEFDNRDGGVVHNIHFFEGDDNDGDSVAETELEVGPIKQTLTFDVEPGAYFYQCDAHPATMEGVLTVE